MARAKPHYSLTEARPPHTRRCLFCPNKLDPRVSLVSTWFLSSSFSKRLDVESRAVPVVRLELSAQIASPDLGKWSEYFRAWVDKPGIPLAGVWMDARRCDYLLKAGSLFGLGTALDLADDATAEAKLRRETGLPLHIVVDFAGACSDPRPTRLPEKTDDVLKRLGVVDVDDGKAGGRPDDETKLTSVAGELVGARGNLPCRPGRSLAPRL